MIAPPRLSPGDTVGVCAPAGPVSAERLKRGVEYLAKRYRVRVSEGALARTGFLAGDDDRRADELNGLFSDPDVRAIFVARGGYGTTRILDRLDADALRRDPVPIVGFSDATALLSWALVRAGVRGIHGPVVGQLGELGDADLEWLRIMLEEPAPAGELGVGLEAVGATASGTVRGRLLGGNLCLLAHLSGTAYAPETADSILFLEDVGERPYRIDRYLTQLKLAGLLEKVRAALLGDFVRCEETIGPPEPSAFAVLDERLSSAAIAGLGGISSGHGERNLALPYGGQCEIDFERGAMRLLEGAVA